MNITCVSVLGMEGAICINDDSCVDQLVCDGKRSICREKSKNEEREFCSDENVLCKEGEGDCDRDEECEGSLVCGVHNCPNGTVKNCCTPPEV